MTIHITEQEVGRLVKIEDAIAAVESVGRSMASGVYFARLQAGGRIETVRLGLVR